MTVRDVYDYINTIAPFNTAVHDNVGLLTGSMDFEVTGICTCLDITNAIIDEAVKKNANLIISHHPVIFDPLKCVCPPNPVYKLVRNNISAIAMHTNFDMAENGVGDALIELLGFTATGADLEPVHPDGLGFGSVCDLDFAFTPKALAEHCKNALDLGGVRYTPIEKEIRRVAVCSGSGGSTMHYAIDRGCDALITGDIKHNVWIDAINSDFVLIDAGHFGTEKCATHRIAALLSKHFKEVPIFAADSDTEPCQYV